MDELVYVLHPDLPRPVVDGEERPIPGRVAREHFDTVLEAKGWQIVDAQGNPLPSDGDLNAMTKAQLVDHAAALGVEVAPSSTKAELIAQITGQEG